jgi:hypothetical protein
MSPVGQTSQRIMQRQMLKFLVIGLKLDRTSPDRMTCQAGDNENSNDG